MEAFVNCVKVFNRLNTCIQAVEYEMFKRRSARLVGGQDSVMKAKCVVFNIRTERLMQEAPALRLGSSLLRRVWIAMQP
jgi:hypothetical protein